MKQILGACVVLLLLASPAFAQAAQVAYDMPVGVSLAQAQSWTPIFYMNTTAFPLTHTCVVAGATVTCTLTVPTPAQLAPALTATGNQNVSVAMRDALLGIESGPSIPLARLRPVAPINPRFQ